jgi:hypothetical protein
MPSPFYSILFCFFLFFIDSFGLLSPSNNNNNIKEETVLRKKSYEDRKKRESVLSNADEYYVTIEGTGTTCSSSLPCDIFAGLTKWGSSNSIIYIQSGNYSSFRYPFGSFSSGGLSGWMSDNGDGGSVVSSDISTYPIIFGKILELHYIFSFSSCTVNFQYIYFMFSIFLDHEDFFDSFFFYSILLIYNFIRL